MLIMCPGSGWPALMVDRNFLVTSKMILSSSSDVMETPLRAIPESKKSFLPSLSEKQKVRVNTVFFLYNSQNLDNTQVGKMVHAIKMGWMKPRPAKKTEAEDESKRKFYMLWQTDDQVKKRI